MSTSATPAFRPTYETCKEVSPFCPIKATTIGYAPNLGVNAFAAAIFGLATLLTLSTGIWKRTWGFSLAVAAGCTLETAGYVSRALLSQNVWNSNAFKTQIVAIVLGPTLLCIGLYLTLKHAVVALNPSLTRLPPRLYPLIFVPADIFSLVTQAIGGALAASGPDHPSLLTHGNRVIIAGIVLQVVVLAIFGLLGGEFLWRVKRWVDSGTAPADSPGLALWRDKKFSMFLYAILVTYVLFFIRCVYRIAEMAGGWGNYIMQDEPSFVVLETFMILIGSALLAIFAPGIFFPQMSRSLEAKEGVKAQTDSESSGNDTAGEKSAQR
ncbi:RTA1 like protein [Echria macrotheca]|uniref:RTA1 like protein n=1 Tax=Echria macrotheca TaxID=438768 RepID=A0AAJ0FA31_9PEZI|nr:RTA1 like protein [Echria macrotheca]